MMNKWKSAFGVQKKSAFCDDDFEESDVIESLSASALSDRMTPNTHGVPARTDSESVKKESDFMGFPSGTAHPAPFRSAFVRNRHAAYIEDEEDEDDVSEAGLANLLASASESAASRCHTECGDVSKVVTFGCADIWNDRPLQKIASPRPEEEGQRRPSLDLPGTPGYRDGKWVL